MASKWFHLVGSDIFKLSLIFVHSIIIIGLMTSIKVYIKFRKACPVWHCMALLVNRSVAPGSNHWTCPGATLSPWNTPGTLPGRKSAYLDTVGTMRQWWKFYQIVAPDRFYLIAHHFVYCCLSCEWCFRQFWPKPAVDTIYCIHVLYVRRYLADIIWLCVRMLVKWNKCT